MRLSCNSTKMLVLISTYECFHWLLHCTVLFCVGKINWSKFRVRHYEVVGLPLEIRRGQKFFAEWSPQILFGVKLTFRFADGKMLSIEKWTCIKINRQHNTKKKLNDRGGVILHEDLSKLSHYSKFAGSQNYTKAALTWHLSWLVTVLLKSNYWNDLSCLHDKASWFFIPGRTLAYRRLKRSKIGLELR